MVSFGTKGGRGSTRGGRRGERGHGDSSGHGESGERDDPGEGNSEVSCFYCKEPGYIKRFCPKLIGKNRQLQSSRFAYVTTNNQTSEIRENCNISMLKSKYAEYLQFQASRQPPPTQPSTVLVQIGNPTACPIPILDGSLILVLLII